MNAKSHIGRAVRWLAAGLGLAAGAYATYVGVTWYRYGVPRPSSPEEQDELLDRFMPAYEVVERHHARIAAPATVTLAAAKDMDLLQSPVVRAIFEARELILGTHPDDRARPEGLLAALQSLGWGVLAESPGREVVVGAVTRPWEANVIFRPLPPHEFAAFREPGYVKIAWTLRADPIAASASVFRTETRAMATDPAARAMFRRYWSFLSPGIIVIRWISLGHLRTEAERRWSGAPAHGARQTAV